MGCSMSLPTAVRRPLGKVKRGLVRLRSKAAVTTYRSDRPADEMTVSVIIPIYNVEAYLDECLDSVRAQHHRRLEILVVDDGSPDRSADIARRHAAEDSRIQVITRENGGLGAARNTGVRHATGDFLFFVDSDDVVPPNAVAAMLAATVRSGSDIVAAPATRFNSTRRWRPEWVELHNQERLHVRIKDMPDLVRNNYTWGKLYRTSFWRAADLWFREGVSYEDQPIITQLFIRAKGIDVITTTTYDWRQRDDLSSISQQMHTVKDLRDRASAWQDSLDAFADEAPKSVFDAWMSSLYLTHFHWYLRSSTTVEDDYWELLQRSIVDVTEHAPEHVVAAVPPPLRLPVELVRRNLREEFHEYKRLGGYAPGNFTAHLEPEGLVLELPTWAERQELGLPVEQYLIPDRDVPVVHRLDRVSWNDSGDLTVAGWAYFRSIDLTTVDTTITLVVRHLRSGHETLVPTHVDPSHTFTAPREDKWADYDKSAFVATVPFSEIVSNLSPRKTGDEWAFYVQVETGRLSRRVPLSNIHPWGSAISMPPRPTGEGFLHRADVRKGQPFRLQYLRQVVAAEGLTLDGLTLRGRLVSKRGEKLSELRLVNVDGRGTYTFPVSPASASPDFSIEIPTTLLDVRPEFERAVATWSLRGVTESGNEVLVTDVFDDDDPGSAIVASMLVGLRSSHRGGVVVEVSPATIEVDAARVDGETLEIAGHVPGVSEGSVTFSLTSVKASSHPVTTTISGQGFEASLPLRHDEPKYGDAVLPVRRYTLHFDVSGTGVADFSGDARASTTLSTTFPVPIDDNRVALTLTRAAQRALVITIGPPRGRQARGSFNRNRLELEHHDLVLARPDEERQGMLVDSYFGEVASCNGVGVHHELRRRGAKIPVYWAVKDYSVGVPEGGIPVIRNSPEWFERLRTAKYFLTNMYQPVYHPKPKGQVIIQTFHGYPFKVMGHPHWKNLQFSKKRIDAFDERAAAWDHLVSPASYATPLLTRDFNYPGDVLEIGYPRNDVLMSDEAPQLRASVRTALGIPEGARAILYAPTFRDYLSEDDHTAPMADLLDADALMRALGDDHVLLIRGHAFHARTEERPDVADRVIDVTDYPEPADLYLASDLAIVDYSSLRFDYGLTGKPMLFLVPDLDLYKQTRGWLIEYEPTAPGPLLASTAEVADAIKDLDRVVSDHAEAYATFARDYLDLDDGKASERFVDAVFVPRGDAPTSP
jgi:CDP-glycerol glycerophosphotransferase